MKKLIPILLALLLFATSADARKPRSDKGKTHHVASSKHSKKKPVHVKSYTKKNGTVVKAHDRSMPGTKSHKKK